MIYQSNENELTAAVNAAMQMCAAARTAPKTRGIDSLYTMVLTGAEKDALADTLIRLGEEQSLGFYVRDAANLKYAQAVVLIGSEQGYRGIGDGCGYCHFGNCEGCAQSGGTCVFDPIDLGIAVGSAVGVAADLRVDTRVMYSVGKAALAHGLFGGEVKIVLGIPVSVSGKSPFFDRKRP